MAEETTEERIMQSLQDARPGLDDVLREMVESVSYQRPTPTQ
jgi:hypothetical protein